MKPSRVWLAFGICIALAVVAGRWLRETVLRVEAARLETERRDEIDQLAQSALWRMEYAIVPLLVQEAARPWFHYRPLYRADRPLEENVIGQPGVAPSPLLDTFVPNTLLHFQIDPNGKMTSPQTPASDALVYSQTQFGAGNIIREAARRMQRLREMFKEEALARVIIQHEEAEVQATLAAGDSPSLLSSIREFRSRRASVQRARRMVEESRDEEVTVALTGAPLEDTMRPYWCSDGLFLARHLQIADQPYVQGVWLDWRSIEERLLDDVRGLLPNARVEPAVGEGADADGMRLASLPVRLIPGEIESRVPRTIAPLHLSLNLAFGGLAVALLSVGVLLRVILVFTARRSEFVSAVTHELRTPLTTLRMYTDLLAGGRIKDEAKRARYIETLRRESERLSHLVENVLAYSRLEGAASAQRRSRVVRFGEAMAAMQERAREHAASCGLELIVEVDEAAAACDVRCDPEAVERIVFNLVDNACKYASRGAPSAIRLGAGLEEGRMVVTVRDYGPGIGSDQASRLFQPFSKSVDEAAVTKPGVGLGLALCRRLAREMGGDLRHDPTWTDGAGFALELKIA